MNFTKKEGKEEKERKKKKKEERKRERERERDVAFVEQLSRVDTTGVEPLAHPLEATQRLRPDVVTETDNREVFQQVAPQTEAGLYLVPKVIE